MYRCTSSWQRACDCRLRRGDRRPHGTSGPGGLFDVLGRIPCHPTISDTSIRANTYLIFETRLGYVSKTYPTYIGYVIRFPLEVSAHHSWQGTARVVHILMHSNRHQKFSSPHPSRVLANVGACSVCAVLTPSSTYSLV